MAAPHLRPTPAHSGGEDRERGRVDFDSVTFGYPTRSGANARRGGGGYAALKDDFQCEGDEYGEYIGDVNRIFCRRSGCSPFFAAHHMASFLEMKCAHASIHMSADELATVDARISRPSSAARETTQKKHVCACRA